jgi:hypothetical protein
MSEWVPMMVAAVALVTALVAAGMAWRAASVAREAEARVVELAAELERQREVERYGAQLVPGIERHLGPTGRVELRFHIENIGRGAAKSVRVSTRGHPLTSALGTDVFPFEIEEIGPGTAVSYPLPDGIDWSEEMPRVELTWVDAAGRQQSSRMSLRGFSA